MKLIFLHGPPASGKYTIARVLHASHGVLNFHNHLTIDVAKALFDFGSEPFWDLTHRLRRTALAARAEEGGADVVFTNCYSSPHDDATVAALEDEVTSRGGRAVAVVPAEWLKRHSVAGLEEFMDA